MLQPLKFSQPQQFLTLAAASSHYKLLLPLEHTTKTIRRGEAVAVRPAAMADLVLGLAKSAVEGTLTAAKSAIEEEEKLKKNMQRDLMLISDEFEMMHSFLNVSKELASDEMVRTLVRQVRNMALDVEDCIESVVLVDINKSDWWRRLLSRLGSCRACVLGAAASPTALDYAVTAIELLKSRVEAMGQRNERYMRIGDSSSKPKEKTPQQAVSDATAVGILIEAREARKNKKSSPRDLIELINKKDDGLALQVISLWGVVGDLGVASIIKKTCDNPEICQDFRCRAWVKLRPPFKLHEFIRSLLVQFYTNFSPPQGSTTDCNLKPADVMTASEAVLMEEFTKQVSNQRYLVFLEDVSSAVDWEAVRVFLPDKKTGSCIVVHTQNLEVAGLCVGESHQVLELEQFSSDHSVCVFFNEKKRSSPQGLIELINKKDHGLPLQVFSVFGTAGDLGMESIMKTCDGDLGICKNFRCRAWVQLMHPFDPHEFIRTLVKELYNNYCPQHGSATDFLKLNGMMTGTEGILIEFVKEVMRNQRYLVFLENLSSLDDWKAVQEFLPDKSNSSCIVVHTKTLELARSCVGESQRELELQQYSIAVRIFSNKEIDKDVEMAMKTEAAHQWLEASKVVGRQADIWTLYDDDLVVRPVYGIAGVGKSYIVKHVYYKQVIEQYSVFQKFGWVDVPHPFNLRDFSWSLLLDLHSGSLQHGSMLRIKDPIQDCRELLRQHTCLIVIDGLQSMDEWDIIKAALAFEHASHNRIIVITHDENVAKYCSKTSWWNVQGLEIDDALDLFKKRASTEGPSLGWSSWPKTPSPAHIERAKAILQKCGGLPQVIVAVGDFMADGWKFEDDDNFMGVLETHPAFGSLRGLFDWVHSYFHSCPDWLKPCIFYLSIFPANHKIRRRRLVWRWIAEGYSRDTKERTAEDNGEESFLHLRKLNMIQVPGSTILTGIMRMPMCQVNGFFREYIISRSMEDNLVFELQGNYKRNSQHTGRHLTIGSTWDRDTSVYQSIDFSSLRSLTVFGRWESFFISDKMRILRVLDLEDALSVNDGDVERMVKMLPRLKFLSLRGCKEITRLPDSFGSLKQLQTLDIRHTSVFALPQSTTTLQKLQHIRGGTTVQLDEDSSKVQSLPPPPPPPRADATASRVTSSINRPRAATQLGSSFRLRRRSWQQQHPGSSSNGGIVVPRGIGKMLALNNISVINVSVASGQSVLEEIKHFTQLRKLGVCGIIQENCKDLCSAISGHAHLESLSLWLDKNLTSGLEAISLPPKKLESLKLYGHVHKLPAWIKQLSNLRKLKLRQTMITQDEIDLLKDLPNLNALSLFFKEFQYDELRFRGYFYLNNLWVLEIACNHKLQSVTFEHHYIMNGLEVLKIRCSNVSSLKFSGLDLLNNLKEVSLSGSYEDKVKQDLNSQLEQHKRKPRLKEEPGHPDGP